MVSRLWQGRDIQGGGGGDVACREVWSTSSLYNRILYPQAQLYSKVAGNMPLLRLSVCLLVLFFWSYSFYLSPSYICMVLFSPSSDRADSVGDSQQQIEQTPKMKL